MSIKVTGSKSITGVGKGKKAKKSSSTGGLDFASMVDSAGEVEENSATIAVSDIAPITGSPLYILDEDDKEEQVPTEPKAHGEYLLKQLESLQQSVLSGENTNAINNLQKALENLPVDSKNLNPKQQKILDELRMRAAVEAAKAKL